MKIDKHINTSHFICDNCNVKSKEFTQPLVYPYNEGWIFIYSLKISNKQIKDKHFCSIKCLNEFLCKNSVYQIKQKKPLESIDLYIDLTKGGYKNV
jgi:hypothetical protein